MKDLRARTSPRRFEDLAAAMTVLADADARRRGLREAITAHLPPELVMHSWIYMQGEQKGLEKGLEKGLAEGAAALRTAIEKTLVAHKATHAILQRHAKTAALLPDIADSHGALCDALGGEDSAPLEGAASAERPSARGRRGDDEKQPAKPPKGPVTGRDPREGPREGGRDRTARRRRAAPTRRAPTGRRGGRCGEVYPEGAERARRA